LKIWKKGSSIWRTAFDIAQKEKKLKKLREESQNPDFWQDKEKAAKISQELNNLKEEIEEFEKLKRDLNDLKELGEEEGVEKEIEKIKKKLGEKELQVFLSGKYDRGNAILQILSGAGGQDAQDWATILLRMYERYCQRKNFKTKILHQSFGEGGGPEGRIGTKSVTLEVKGNFAYGLFKKENGVHRLVRISPFSAQSLRHTSFALVEVLPEIPKVEKEKIKIKPEDLKIEFYRASGPGGQYVNKKETAVRITHLPTGIQSASQSERFQQQNREKAMELLFIKLYQFYREKKDKELAEIKGKKISPSWGNQIRSYVLHPYKLVKDLRTGIESSDTEGVLDGKLDEFIEAEIKL
jgi:peptide chain release factor 2